MLIHRAATASWLAGVVVLGLAPCARAQDTDLRTWSFIAAKGAFDLCRSDAPDAARVADHGEVWGWPRFVEYLEHPTGYRREAGGQSRRSKTIGDDSASVELGVQSGQVTSAAPANIRYFRCNVAVDKPVAPDLETYFTQFYGPPIAKTDAGTVWMVGQGGLSLAADASASDDAMLAPVVAAGVGKGALRIELTHFGNYDRARMTMLSNEAPE